MFWWMVLIGLVAVLVVITVVENRRGSTGAARAEDRHLHAPDKRGAPSVEATSLARLLERRKGYGG